MSVLFKYLVSQGWTFGAVSDSSWYAYPWQSECPGLVRSTAYQEAAAMAQVFGSLTPAWETQIDIQLLASVCQALAVVGI